MANKRKKETVDIDLYNKIVRQNKVQWDVFEEMKKYFEFPYNSLLEVGTGTSNFMTRYLIDSERSKSIDKFYAMEPVDEFFEESKRSVVRLSRTDATLHEFFGGNPFDVITFAMVYSHVNTELQRKLIQNIYNNLKDEESRFVAMDVFLPEYEEGQKEEVLKTFYETQLKYAEKTKNDYMQKYFQKIIDGKQEDYLTGKYKTPVKQIVDDINYIGFDSVKVELFEGKGKFDWEALGYYIIVADKE